MPRRSARTQAIPVSRREWLASGLAGLGGLATGEVAAQAPGAARPPAREPRNDEISVSRRGQYAKVPLRQESINVSAIQSRVRAVDGNNPAPGVKENLAHVLRLIDYAQNMPEEWGAERVWGARQDLVCLHEFPVQGWAPWSRAQVLRVAFDIPGPESEAIGQKAKKHNCYVAFGCYARDKEWPDHVINMSVIVGPTGEVVSKQWKNRNILGMFGEVALFGTTVYDVLDRYVEMYGWDATLPVARTDIGNLAMTAVGNEPALYQCLALKGTEMLILTVTGGSNGERALETARANRIYCVGVGNSVSPGNPGFPESAGAQDGGTLISDPRGVALARSDNHHEGVITARIPIGDFRQRHRPIELPMAMLLPVYEQYQPTFGPNAFLEYLPRDLMDAGAYVRRRMSGRP